ncbi:MAG: MerR family transcriptional regulator [Desulfobacteraceae bacterium]|nr:MerR family transcriptional regulator [Desulfobacteraceae bacterium]
MKTYSISTLAKSFGLSRSALLYYDRIGLLKAPERSPAGYRIYTEDEYKKLEHICIFRDAGLPLADVKKLLADDAAPGAGILEKRLFELGNQILQLRNQQHLIISMLKNMTGKTYSPVIDKKTWVMMLEKAGMDEAAMERWHAEFERCSPKAHHELLLSLGIPENEAKQIRQWSRKMNDKQ